MMNGVATLFQSFGWNRLAAAQFADREAPFIVLAENDNGMALIPAAISGSAIVMLGEALFDYRDCLCAGDPEVLSHAWATLADLRLPLSVHALRGKAARHNWLQFNPKPYCSAPGIASRDTSAHVLEANHRKLGRLSRRIERQGIRLSRYDGSESGLLRWIYRQKSRQFHGAGNNLFEDERRIEFMIAAAALDPSACEMFAYETGASTVAALVSFRDGETRRFYTIYYDERWAKESPGQVLLYETTVRSLRENFDCDYMTGEQPHKMRLATLLVPLYRVQLNADEFSRAVHHGDPAHELAA